jgi:heme exporter protein A
MDTIPSLRAAPPAPLELRGVAHRFASGWVLRSCDLRIEAGEAVALLGANGSGKTTLLRIAATLLRPRRGEGSVCGHDLRTRPAGARAHLGFMGYAPALYEDLTAEENLRFAEQMRGRRPASGALRAALAEVALAPWADARVREFSTGMRRRLGLARILLAPPSLLLLDEPYAALDAEAAQLVNRVVGRLLERGCAVLAATHDLERAQGVLSRVVRLERGVLFEQRPEEARWAARVADGGELAASPFLHEGSGR